MQRRYEIAPLLDHLGLTLTQLNAVVRMNGQAYRDVQVRGVTELVADRWCCRFGVHPAEVWPSWLEDRRREQWARSARKRWANDPEHRARRAEYMRQYRQDAAKVLAAQKKAWTEANREKVRARNREAMRRFRARQKDAAVKNDREKNTDPGYYADTATTALDALVAPCSAPGAASVPQVPRDEVAA